MRDGIHVGSSSYDSRTLTMEIECRKSTQDLAAVEMQKLWRELDRASNFLMYQPNGLTKPVFFRTYRSDTSQLVDVMAQAAMRTFTVEVLAEPFALGLREDIAAATVAPSSTAYGVTISTVKGDVATPPVLFTGTTAITSQQWLLATTNPVRFYEAELAVNGTDAADVSNAEYSSGAGVSVSFATNAAMTTRLSDFLGQQNPITAGRHRALARMKLSTTGSTVRARLLVNGTPVPTPSGAAYATLSDTSTAQVVDLGFVHVAGGGVGFDTALSAGPELIIQLQRVSGTATVVVDWLMTCLPDSTAVINPPVGSVGATRVIDAVQDSAYYVDSSPPFTANVDGKTGMLGHVGGFPLLVPGKTNVLIWLLAQGAMASTTSVSVSYWPLYVHARPVSS
ncbi:hypothetical protein [Nocardioides zhouii]|uniref:Uncharacterized protein n=1 Tax=Nocardioides zhouii TaxID=1168729 RepID=A0A4Q2TCB4_9ACTN|nr:hypothetical protein [Nocardioides zhouii]RYC14559.1 hypothetical protein EUA94_00060 [Nocardioides zhouii]